MIADSSASQRACRACERHARAIATYSRCSARTSSSRTLRPAEQKMLDTARDALDACTLLRAYALPSIRWIEADDHTQGNASPSGA